MSITNKVNGVYTCVYHSAGMVAGITTHLLHSDAHLKYTKTSGHFLSFETIILVNLQKRK